MTNKRALNVAKIKVEVINLFKKELKITQYKDVHVKDLAKIAGISKVTFFKYFETKEDLFRYAFRIWCMEISIKLQESKKEGIEKLDVLLDLFCEEYYNLPQLFRGYLSYNLHHNKILSPFPIKKEERAILFKNVDDIEQIEIKSFIQHLQNIVLESIFKTQISKSDATDVAGFINAIVWGTIATSSSNAEDKFEFKKRLKMWISYAVAGLK